MEITQPVFFIIAGRPRSGKSFLIRYLMYQHRHFFDYGIVFSKTKFNEGFNYVPTEYVHPSYSESALRGLMDIQSDLAEKKIKKNAFVIFDDCLVSEFKTELFQDLVTQYRHYNITLIISTQYIYKINPTMRECATYAVVFRQSTTRSMEALYESFGGHFNKFNEFKDYIMKNTGDFKFVLIDVNSHKDDKDEIYQVMKAPEKIPKFHMKYNQKI